MAEKAFLVINAQITQLKSGVTTIGRVIGNHVIIRHPNISRNHAEIRSEGGTYTLHDLKSTNGTFLKGKPVSNAELFSGDIIMFGDFPVTFLVEDDQFSKKENLDTASLHDKTGKLET